MGVGEAYATVKGKGWSSYGQEGSELNGDERFIFHLRQEAILEYYSVGQCNGKSNNSHTAAFDIR